ncbi:MAG: hypothetical protein V2I54_14380 [Bacteroidales bacterium]|jgi:hypothetical protein|nr:hypothetical protein [Bacteroidales bacterium]
MKTKLFITSVITLVCFAGSAYTQSDHTLKDIQKVLDVFEQGYLERDTSNLNSWCEAILFDNVEIIGTYSIHTDTREWCTGIDKATELFRNDWLNWGDLDVNQDHAHIDFDDNLAWVSFEATLTKSPKNSNGRTVEESAGNLLKSINAISEKEGTPSNKFKLLETAYLANLILYQYEQGEEFIWPVRISGVLQKKSGKWKFRQIHFSYPNRGFPNVRL